MNELLNRLGLQLQFNQCYIQLADINKIFVEASNNYGAYHLTALMASSYYHQGISPTVHWKYITRFGEELTNYNNRVSQWQGGIYGNYGVIHQGLSSGEALQAQHQAINSTMHQIQASQQQSITSISLYGSSHASQQAQLPSAVVQQEVVKKTGIISKLKAWFKKF